MTPTKKRGGDDFERVATEFGEAIAALVVARKLLRKSRTVLCDDQVNQLSSLIAEALERLSDATSAAQSRFS